MTDKGGAMDFEKMAHDCMVSMLPVASFEKDERFGKRVFSAKFSSESLEDSIAAALERAAVAGATAQYNANIKDIAMTARGSIPILRDPAQVVREAKAEKEQK